MRCPSLQNPTFTPLHCQQQGQTSTEAPDSPKQRTNFRYCRRNLVATLPMSQLLSFFISSPPPPISGTNTPPSFIFINIPPCDPPPSHTPCWRVLLAEVKLSGLFHCSPDEGKLAHQSHPPAICLEKRRRRRKRRSGTGILEPTTTHRDTHTNTRGESEEFRNFYLALTVVLLSFPSVARFVPKRVARKEKKGKEQEPRGEKSSRAPLLPINVETSFNPNFTSRFCWVGDHIGWEEGGRRVLVKDRYILT